MQSPQYSNIAMFLYNGIYKRFPYYASVKSYIPMLIKLKAISNENRLQILHWLADPVSNFPPQEAGDLAEDGVCVISIAEKLGVSQPTASEHLKVLAIAGLVTGTKVKQWTFYRRNEEEIKAFKEEIRDTL
ncbi:MAG: ArsR/SmtB family transcription factor [Rhodothermales bacterium]